MRVSSSLDWSRLKRPIKESKPRGAVKITEAQKTAGYSLDLEKTKKCISKKNQALEKYAHIREPFKNVLADFVR